MRKFLCLLFVLFVTMYLSLYNLYGCTFNSENCMKLLGVEIDNNFSFEKHICTLGKKASSQLNAISRIQKFVGFKEK